ncbi:MAG: DUF4142 domain-containing protein [Cytophagaceae bacterium]
MKTTNKNLKNQEAGSFTENSNTNFNSMAKGALFAAALFLIAATGCKKKDDDKTTDTSHNTNSTDQSFMVKAAQGDKAEIELGQLAATNASDQAVKDFGQMMVNAHTQTSTQLKTIAAQKSVNVPDTLDAAHAALKTQLQSLSGFAFDSVYMHSQVNDHKDAQTNFQTEISGGQDSDVRNFAIQNFPAINHHLQLADSLYFGMHR